MRCQVCDDGAGWFRRQCEDCQKLKTVFEQVLGAPMGDVFEALIGTQVARAKIERFLDSDWRGRGTVRDQIAAEAANQLLQAFGGTKGKQTAAEVGKLRARGAWTQLDKPPEDSC